jgi:hypothetical protein
MLTERNCNPSLPRRAVAAPNLHPREQAGGEESPPGYRATPIGRQREQAVNEQG